MYGGSYLVRVVFRLHCKCTIFWFFFGVTIGKPNFVHVKRKWVRIKSLHSVKMTKWEEKTINRKVEKNRKMKQKKNSFHYTWICNWIKSKLIWKGNLADLKFTNVMWHVYSGFFFLLTLMMKDCLRPNIEKKRDRKPTCYFLSVSLYLCSSCTCNLIIIFFILFIAYDKRH